MYPLTTFGGRAALALAELGTGVQKKHHCDEARIGLSLTKYAGNTDPLPATMEHLETQASDLRFLATAPVALSDAGSVYNTPRPGQQGSPRSASYGDNSAPTGDGDSGKRKSTDDGGQAGKQTRSKRNRVS